MALYLPDLQFTYNSWLIGTHKQQKSGACFYWVICHFKQLLDFVNSIEFPFHSPPEKGDGNSKIFKNEPSQQKEKQHPICNLPITTRDKCECESGDPVKKNGIAPGVSWFTDYLRLP